MGLERLQSFNINEPERCEKCGSMHVKYDGVGEYKCEDCGFIMYDDYGRVRAFLEKYPGATVVETSLATGVSKKRIRYLLEEDKIQIAPGSAVYLHCSRCGADITSGRYCANCLKEVVAADKAGAVKSRISGGFGTGKTDDRGARRFERK